MGETAAEKKGIKNWFRGLKVEFKKIIWPDKRSAAKQTVAVVAISVVLGAVIKVLDMLIQVGMKFIA